jgi:hypothetical protein
MVKCKWGIDVYERYVIHVVIENAVVRELKER